MKFEGVSRRAAATLNVSLDKISRVTFTCARGLHSTAQHSPAQHSSIVHRRGIGDGQGRPSAAVEVRWRHCYYILGGGAICLCICIGHLRRSFAEGVSCACCVATGGVRRTGSVASRKTLALGKLHWLCSGRGLFLSRAQARKHHEDGAGQSGWIVRPFLPVVVVYDV